MNRLCSLLFMFLFSFPVLHAQLQAPVNVELLAAANDHNIGSRSYSDVWGFVGDDGREYGVIGVREATVIYDLSDPQEPIEVAYIPGTNSIWRDIKSHDGFVYVVADRGQDGLLIVDMRQAPDSISWAYWRPNLATPPDVQTMDKCHNLYIDEQGIAYISGCNVNSGGVLMFDLASVPDTGIPTYLGPATSRYSHDCFARGDTLYSADLNNGFFSVTDVRDKQDPQLLAVQNTSRNFTHNVWPSDDGKYLFTTDERSNAYIDAYDISALDNIERVDQYRPLATEGTGVLPHNVHYYNGYLVISYYTDGLKIVDAHRPGNLIEVGSYDTNLRTGSGDGCWGAFPYLPSGRVLATDMDNGLFVFEVDYQRAAYLEGMVRDAQTGFPLVGVDVQIISDDPNQEQSGPDGSFQTGQLSTGRFSVLFSRSGYEDQTIEVDLVSGQVVELEVHMQPVAEARVSGAVISRPDRRGLPGFIRLIGPNGDYTINAASNGSFSLQNVKYGEYTLYAGLWGYRQAVIEDLEIRGDERLEVLLESGYEDDFVLDLGWTTTGDATTGQWVRETPIGTEVNGEIANPVADLPDDLGDRCYLTGNGDGDEGDFDVDNGTAVLISPPLNLQEYQNPVLSYAIWFYDGGGFPNPDDTLRIQIASATDTVLLEEITSNTSDWLRSSFALGDTVDLSQPQRLIVSASDLPGTPHLVEASFDGFRVEEQTATSVVNPEIVPLDWAVYPNPFTSQIRIELPETLPREQTILRMYDMFGKPLSTWSLAAHQRYLELGADLVPGVYLLEFRQGNRRAVRKIVKH